MSGPVGGWLDLWDCPLLWPWALFLLGLVVSVAQAWTVACCAVCAWAIAALTRDARVRADLVREWRSLRPHERPTLAEWVRSRRRR